MAITGEVMKNINECMNVKEMAGTMAEM